MSAVTTVSGWQPSAASVDEVFSVSDYLSLHTNLTPETRDLVRKETIAKMKKGVLILNCARGEIIPTITGTAHVTAEARLHLDPRDPFRWGIRP